MTLEFDRPDYKPPLARYGLEFLAKELARVKHKGTAKVLAEMLEFTKLYDRIPDSHTEFLYAEARAKRISEDYQREASCKEKRALLAGKIEAPAIVSAFFTAEARVRYSYKIFQQQAAKNRKATSRGLNNSRHFLPSLVAARNEAEKALAKAPDATPTAEVLKVKAESLDQTINEMVNETAKERLEAMQNLSPQEQATLESLDRQRERYESQLSEMKLGPNLRRQLEQNVARVAKTQAAILDGSLYAPIDRSQPARRVPAAQDDKNFEHLSRRKVALERQISDLQNPSRPDRNALGIRRRVDQLQASLAHINASLEEIEQRRKERGY